MGESKIKVSFIYKKVEQKKILYICMWVYAYMHIYSSIYKQPIEKKETYFYLLSIFISTSSLFLFIIKISSSLVFLNNFLASFLVSDLKMRIWLISHNLQE